MTSNLLVHNEWKYVPQHTLMIESERGGPTYPNATSDATGDWIDAHNYRCVAPDGCLFNVVEDVSEQHECSADHPEIVTMMKALLAREAKTIWSVSHKNAPGCRQAAEARYGGFYGPWEELD